MPDRPIHADLIMIAAATTPAERKRALGRRQIGLDFQFQLPGSELAEIWVELDLSGRRVSKNPLVLNANLSCSKIWPDLELPVKLDFLPRCQVHLLRNVDPKKCAKSGGDQLSAGIRHGWRD